MSLIQTTRSPEDKQRGREHPTVWEPPHYTATPVPTGSLKRKENWNEYLTKTNHF
jgi:hypothetical protein